MDAGGRYKVLALYHSNTDSTCCSYCSPLLHPHFHSSFAVSTLVKLQHSNTLASFKFCSTHFSTKTGTLRASTGSVQPWQWGWGQRGGCAVSGLGSVIEVRTLRLPAEPPRDQLLQPCSAVESGNICSSKCFWTGSLFWFIIDPFVVRKHSEPCEDASSNMWSGTVSADEHRTAMPWML